MKSICAVLTLVGLVAAVPRPETSTFTTKFDNFNVKEAMDNARLRQGYFNCVMTGKKCTPEGETLRKAIPEAVESDCKPCSEKQREQTEYVLRYLHDNDKPKFDALTEKFDKDKKLQKKYAHKL